MCGRYVLYDTDDIPERFGYNTADDFHANYNVAPSQMMPVITQDGLKQMRWGLIPQWAKDEKIGYKLINARSETVFEKPMWKGLIKRKKCLIPANGFYEWKRLDGGKQPYFIHPKDQGLFAFAGLWETWKHEGKEWETYTILTTEPNLEMENIHNRMPVILHRDDEDNWLGLDDEKEIQRLLRPYEDNELEIYTVSKEVNTTAINNKTLIGPINSG